MRVHDQRCHVDRVYSHWRGTLTNGLDWRREQCGGGVYGEPQRYDDFMNAFWPTTRPMQRGGAFLEHQQLLIQSEFCRPNEPGAEPPPAA